MCLWSPLATFISFALLLVPGSLLKAQPDSTAFQLQYNQAAAQVSGLQFGAALNTLENLLSALEPVAMQHRAMKMKALQLKGNAYRFDHQYPPAIAAYEEALQWARQVFGPDEVELTTAYYYMAWMYRQAFKMDQWKAYIDTSKLIFDRILGPNHCWQARILENRARMNYFSFGHIDTTIAMLDRAQAIYADCEGDPGDGPRYAITLLYDAHVSKRDFEKAHAVLDQRLAGVIERTEKKWIDHRAWLESDRGNLFRLEGDYVRAVNQYELANTIFQNLQDGDPIGILSTNSNRADCLAKLGRTDEALVILRSEMQKYENQDIAPDARGFLYEIAGNAFKAEGQCDSALYFYRKCLRAFAQVLDTANAKFIPLYLDMAECLEEQGQPSRALDYLELNTQLIKTKYSQEHPATTRVGIAKSRCFLVLDDPETALQILIDSQETMAMDGDRPRFPEIALEMELQYGQVYSRLAEAGTDPTLIERATDHIENAARQLRAVRDLYVEEDIRSHASVRSNVFESGVGAFYTAYKQHPSPTNFEKAFAVAEQQRALILADAIREAELFATINIPQEIVTHERDIKKRLRQIERQLENEFNRTPIKGQCVQSLLEERQALTNQMDVLISRYRQEFPNYYKARYAHEPASLLQIRSLLVPQELFVEYFLTSHESYVFIIGENIAEIIRIPIDFDLAEKIGSLLEILRHPQQGQDIQNYIKIAYEIFAHLVKPVIDKSGDATTLAIVPDGLLHYLPFEALVSEKSIPVDWHEVNTLMHQYTIIYQSSATTWHQLRKKKVKSNKELLAVAPDFKKTTSDIYRDFGPLNYNVDEVQKISAGWEGEILTGADAMRSNFLAIAPNFGFLHLATHARADPDHTRAAYLVLPQQNRDTFLYVDEIYGLGLNAEMVTLSACETGVGTLQRGEGMISLARAFTYAGARSIVTSLWSVNDQATSILMEYFYANLKEGMDKGAALRNAKLKYLENISGPHEAHPAYWAGFVLMGDAQWRGESSSHKWPWVVIPILLASAAIFYLFKKGSVSV